MPRISRASGSPSLSVFFFDLNEEGDGERANERERERRRQMVLTGSARERERERDSRHQATGNFSDLLIEVFFSRFTAVANTTGLFSRLKADDYVFL